MSIDFNGTVSNVIDPIMLTEAIDRTLLRLVGFAPVLETEFYPSAEAFVRGEFAHETPPGWTAGPGLGGRWVRLRVAPEAQADLSIESMEEADHRIADAEAIASFRNAASVLLAIAAIIAAVEIGEGSFQPNVTGLIDPPARTSSELIQALSLTEQVQDLDSAARLILARTTSFAGWVALTRPST